jgi:hypothetical protein
MQLDRLGLRSCRRTSTGPLLRSSTHLSILFRIVRFGILAAASSEDRDHDVDLEADQFGRDL